MDLLPIVLLSKINRKINRKIKLIQNKYKLNIK